jgi:hypothetical protein
MNNIGWENVTNFHHTSCHIWHVRALLSIKTWSGFLIFNVSLWYPSWEKGFVNNIRWAFWKEKVKKLFEMLASLPKCECNLLVLVQFDRWIHWIFTKSYSVRSMNSLKIQWKHSTKKERINFFPFSETSEFTQNPMKALDNWKNTFLITFMS